jgi:hypothetical protein
VLLARDRTNAREKLLSQGAGGGIKLRLFLHCRIESPGGFEGCIQLLVSHLPDDQSIKSLLNFHLDIFPRIAWMDGTARHWPTEHLEGLAAKSRHHSRRYTRKYSLACQCNRKCREM